MRSGCRLGIAVLAGLVLTACSTAAPRRHLVIVVDGLRPDYVTAEGMPNLTALAGRGVVFSRHHSVYPTVTRVNASSISTGSYPETHGLMGNSVFFPSVEPTRFLDTSDQSNLAFLKVGLPRIDPSVTVMWLSDLDSTAHDKGMGDPATVDVLRHVDSEIKRIEDGLRAAEVFDDYNIWVTSDHGFSTHTGAVALDTILKPFAGALPDGSPRIVANGGAIYVRDGDQATLSAIVAGLQRTAGVGAIFTRANARQLLEGAVPGTLSFDVVRWDHDRSAQILFSPDWTDGENAHGLRGMVSSGGVAGHGSASPWDVHNTLIAAGPDLKQGTTIDAPSANVDFAPTFLTLLRLPVPATMQGRPLAEALRGRPDASAVTFTHTVRTPDDRYAATAMFSTVSVNGRETRYFDGAKVFRPPK